MVKSDVYSSPIVFAQADVRVGKVLEAVAHPTSEKHYIEKVDIGKGEELEMVMEHQPYMSEEEVIGRLVIVLCNLKPLKVAKHKSQGAILAVMNAKGQYELLEPSPDAEVGERVYAVGEELCQPVTAIQMKKNKVWETLTKELKTTNKCELMFKDRYLIRSRAGPLRVESLKKCELAPAKLK